METINKVIEILTAHKISDEIMESVQKIKTEIEASGSTGKPKRKLTGFNLFMKERTPIYKASLGDAKMDTTSAWSEVAKEWGNLSKEEQMKFNERAATFVASDSESSEKKVKVPKEKKTKVVKEKAPKAEKPKKEKAPKKTKKNVEEETIEVIEETVVEEETNDDDETEVVETVVVEEEIEVSESEEEPVVPAKKGKKN